jgi:hypothetical protein
MTTIQAGAEPRTALPGGRGVRRSELTIIYVISETSCYAMGSNVLVLNRSASSALTRVGRVRDCDVWSRSGYGRWNREGNLRRPH